MITLLRIPYYNFLAKKLIKKHAYERKPYEDRDVLERIIFPYVLARFNPKRILDVGREDYQEFYNQYFSGRELWTIDVDPGKQEYGSIHHITDDVANIKKYFKNDYFDFIVMNGVFGWGLDETKKIQQTFNAVYDILKPGGVFVLGYNDDVVPLAEIEGLKKLKSFEFKPLKGKSFKCINGNHCYQFYTK